MEEIVEKPEKVTEKVESFKPLDLGSLGEKVKKKIDWRFIAGGVAIVLLGILSGWGLFKFSSGRKGLFGPKIQGTVAEGEEVEVGETYGSTSESFKDNAIGVVEKGGFNGEGTHKLLREGGESQTAYLTSSVLDLDLFVDHKVEIWGETFAAQKAGWLLDVGAVKVLE